MFGIPFQSYPGAQPDMKAQRSRDREYVFGRFSKERM